MMRRGESIFLVLLLAFPRADAHGQTRDPAPAPPPSPRALFAVATVGSVLGFLAGQSTQPGSDYLALDNAVRPGLGSVIGVTVGLEVASNGDVPALGALASGLVGVTAGVAGGRLLDGITRGSLGGGGFVVGFALGQGLVAGAMAARRSDAGLEGERP